MAGFFSQEVSYLGNVSASFHTFNFGVDSDIGIKYDVTDVFYINIGNILTSDFANYSSEKSSLGDASDWVKDYSMFGLRPYICIGFNWHRGTDNPGKPKT